MSSLLIVDAEALPSTPPAFQQYVSKFFLKQKILGNECYVAQQKTWFSHSDWERYRYNPENKGVAPGHSTEVNQFKDGLPEGMSLSEWIRKQEGQICWTLYAPEDHDGCGNFDD